MLALWRYGCHLGALLNFFRLKNCWG